MTLLSGTLADLDLPSIAAMTSLGRSSLRLDLRGSDGALIGSLVLKAGRVVSATAGAMHGREALRVLLRAASDARFQLAHEPLDFVLTGALASVDELAGLGRAPTTGRRQATTGDATGATQAGAPSRSAVHRAVRPDRVPMMQGPLDEFDLLTLLQTIGLGRQLIEIDVRDRAGAVLGTIGVKSGNVVAARAGARAGVEAIAQLVGAPDGVAFAAFRVASDLEQTPVLASVAEIGLRLARPAATADRIVIEGSLSEFDLPMLLQTMGCSRQHCALEIHDERTMVGRIAVKSGIVVSAIAGRWTGIRAVQYLSSSYGSDRFRLVQLAGEVSDQTPLGPIAHILLELDAPARPAVARGPRASTGTPHVPVPAPPTAPDDRVGPSIAAAELLLMEGELSEFDVRTLLEVLAATRQHARLQILGGGPAPLGEITLKAGWIVSGHAGSLHGKDALSFLLGASRQMRFRVVTGASGRESEPPLGSVRELLDGIPRDRASPPERTTRTLRWAIPISFVVGGTAVFLVLRGWTAEPAHRPPAARNPPPAELTAAPQPAALRSAPPPPAAKVQPPSPGLSPPGLPPAAPPAAAPAVLPPAAPPAAAPARSAEPPEPPAPPRVTARPQLGLSVKTAQAALKRLGYDPGPIDNMFGHLTRLAVIQFQRAQHLPITGVLDQETWSAIVSRLTQ